MNIGDMCS